MTKLKPCLHNFTNKKKCIICRRNYHNQYNKKNKVEKHIKYTIYRMKTKNHYNEYLKKYRLDRKIKVFCHYSNSNIPYCACCKCTQIEFLSIDHLNGGGNRHRKAIKAWGVLFYSWLIRNKYPPEYQVLCHNCNLAKGFLGICPHEKVRKQLLEGYRIAQMTQKLVINSKIIT